MNWTIEVMVSLISWILITIAAIEHTRLYLRTKIRSYLFLCLSWVFFSIYDAGEFFSYLLLSDLVFRLHFIAIMFTGLFLILFVDFIKQESAGKVKIAILSGISSLILFTSLQDGSVMPQTFPNGALSLQTAGWLRYFLIVFSMIFSFLYLYYIAVLNKNAPKSLKKYSRVALAGTLIFSVLSTVAFASGLTLVIPGIQLLSEAIGCIITTWAFVKQPHLAYILPFKVMRLLVIDSRSGVDILDHAWVREGDMVGSSLVSGMIQGINAILRESFQRGNCKEIAMDQGVVMLNFAAGDPLLVALVTTKSSRSLQASLSRFVNSFSGRFKDAIAAGGHSDFGNDGAIELVKVCFPYIPDYK